MKFNLKNRPPAMSVCSQVEEWFEAFEKELREEIKDIEEENDRILKDVNEDQLLPDSNAHAIMRSSYHNNGQILILKEILGDETEAVGVRVKDATTEETTK